MLLQHPIREHVEHKLLEKFNTSTAVFQEEAALQGEMFLDKVKSGSVVLQLRPITDQAVRTLLNAKENNKLLQMILGILKQINISEMFNGSETLEINLQVCYASQVSNQGKLLFPFSHFITLFKYRIFYIYISQYIVLGVFQ